MSKVLVTGGAGFIGSHVADALIGREHDVVVVDDLSGGFESNVPSGASFIRASVTDAARISALCEKESFDYVFHLAAYAAEGLSHFIKRFNYTNNVIGSVNLINAAVNTGVKGFVFTSSIAVYGANAGSSADRRARRRTPMIPMALPNSPSSRNSRRRAQCSGWTT